VAYSPPSSEALGFDLSGPLPEGPLFFDLANPGQELNFDLSTIVAVDGDNILFDCREELTGTVFLSLFNSVATEAESDFGLQSYFEFVVSEASTESEVILTQIQQIELIPSQTTPFASFDVRRLIAQGFISLDVAGETPITKFYSDPVLIYPRPQEQEPEAESELEQLPLWRKPYRTQGGVGLVWDKPEQDDVKRAINFEESEKLDKKEDLTFDKAEVEDKQLDFVLDRPDRLDVKIKGACGQATRQDKSKLVNFDDLQRFEKQQLRIVFSDFDSVLDTFLSLENKIPVPVDVADFDLPWDRLLEQDKGLLIPAIDLIRSESSKLIPWGKVSYPRPCYWLPKLPENATVIDFHFEEADRYEPPKPRLVRRGSGFRTIAGTCPG